ncbi:MBL fold metallo-hydrolase [Tabrizicola sp. J26]|uniref:MBL fold metallo-hydrolase n=1 Tax=Alitabrizicola rongguiensis TaxID=2909234 RepID=UPI001F26EF9A|nr:MBL fold metallo-hydrolase [Tabrizicola rongguiensis]MCF1708551.1 MBL fold metallo-hydrolase [Tabrizicola rongguiensis]
MIRAAICLNLALTLPAFAQDRIPSHCIALAHAGPERVMTAAFGDPLADDRVRLTYVGHSTFVIETPGGLVAATDFTGRLGPISTTPDVVTMNNAHGSHWTAAPDPAIPHVLPGWWQNGAPADHSLDLGEMLVRNVTTDQRNRSGGFIPNGNSIFIFEVAGLCIGHLGHLHQIPSPEQYAMIGRLDVVMVPVDGGYTMSTEAMAEVVKRLRSSVVIPMHWFSGVSLEQFLVDMDGAFDVVRPEQSSLEVALTDLPTRPTIMVLEPGR